MITEGSRPVGTGWGMTSDDQAAKPRRPLDGRPPLGWPNLTRPILTQDQRFLKILNLIPIYARTEFPVLITGEPGTGKDLVAEAIWALSNRAQKPSSS